MNEIINTIREKKSFGDIDVTEFAPPNKWADVIARGHLGKDGKDGKDAKEMKTTQLRKVFTAIKQMDLKVRGKRDDEIFSDHTLFMLVPQLAYAKARGFINKDFYELMKTIIGDGQSGKIKKVKDFKRFSEFMTAIVAYHKFHHTKGGKAND